MLNKKSKYFVPAFIMLAGLFFAVYSFKTYPFYSPTQGPMQGFMPAILGILLAVSGLAALVQAKNEEDKALDLRNWSVVFAMGLVLICNFMIGTLPSVTIFLVVWLRFVSRYSWKTTLLVTVILMAFVIGIFLLWMDIPFTQGILFEALLG